MERQRFLCELCGACYTYNIYNKDLRKHCRDKHEGSRYYQCNVCRRVFTTLSNLRRHTLEVHSTDNFPCDLCNASFKSVRYLKDHKFAAHVARADPPPMSPSQHDIVSEPAASPMPGPSRMTVSPIAGPSHKIVEPTATTSNNEDQRLPENSTSTKHDEISAFIPIERAFNSRVKTYFASNLPPGDLLTVLESVSQNIVDKLEEVLCAFTLVKFNFFVECDFGNIYNEMALHNFKFKTKNQAVFRNDDLKVVVRKHIEKIIKESEDSAMKGSGWFYLNIRSLELTINTHNPLQASGFLNMPSKFRYSKSLINIRNFDKYCFKYCILSKIITSHKDLWMQYQNRPDLEDMNLMKIYGDNQLDEDTTHVSLCGTPAFSYIGDVDHDEAAHAEVCDGRYHSSEQCILESTAFF
ncbi:hypothetical protein ANN_27111 [Periplaneta americana]|uniref:C2H2-type domain-containing protein n=1 Tax=Periplaneta americana TaxID=6978 RepID=A0ABQ8RX43_PERAM|nr:hypothetical protein ANN_27111 [Periplaneta americana]